ncbi:DUF1613-domain-containing protein, partial [Nadsonia fulvescens var. elongata DSM 6958]
MMNLIKQPNVNSTIIMRADILNDDSKDEPDLSKGHFTSTENKPEPRFVTADGLTLDRTIVRRIIPRNPQRDAIILQSCLIFKDEKVSNEENDSESVLVVYVPHIDSAEDCPYYLPPAKAVGILYAQGTLSVHYQLFDEEVAYSTGSANESEIKSYMHFAQRDSSERFIRIALHLLHTAYKHSNGVMKGYKKRVNHDLVVEKVAFQDRYVNLKQKYAKDLVASWAESTDPKKHVFEDLAIAAFLVELWGGMYKQKSDFKFVDLGCGNGLLVHVLMQEGFTGVGIDARARKSWLNYPEEVQKNLKEQVVIPAALLEDEDGKINGNTQFRTGSDTFITADDILADDSIGVCHYPKGETFIIGNHSDELTCWIPLLGYPFMVIPCCSHALTGARHRFPPTKNSTEPKSTYACLVDHVESIAKMVGWKTEKEMLRIPSTRNAAILGRTKAVESNEPFLTIAEVIEKEGGADGWLEKTLALRAKNPRDH